MSFETIQQVNAVCSTLSTNSDMKSIISCSSQPFEQLATYNNRYLNHQQLVNKCMSYHQEMCKSRVNIMNMHCKLNRLGTTLDMHQRFLLSISQNNIPRLPELVAVALRNKRSIQYILSKVLNVIDGVYLARPSQDDKELAYLILQFGVFMRDTLPRVSHHKECGIVNSNTSHQSGSHWVCYFKDGMKHRVYFDSFGQMTLAEIQKYLKGCYPAKYAYSSTRKYPCMWAFVFIFTDLSDTQTSIVSRCAKSAQ